MEAFLPADPRWIAAQRGKNRDRCPVVTPRQLVGHLPDPRTAPFDARHFQRPFLIKTAAQAVACFLFIAFVWTVLS